MGNIRRKTTVTTLIIITELRQGARDINIPEWVELLLGRAADHFILLDERLRVVKRQVEYQQAEIEVFREKEMTEHRE